MSFIGPAVGTKVMVTTLGYTHTAVVIHNAGSIGGDGRHWVKVAVDYGSTSIWEACFERHELEVVS